MYNIYIERTTKKVFIFCKGLFHEKEMEMYSKCVLDLPKQLNLSEFSLIMDVRMQKNANERVCSMQEELRFAIGSMEWAKIYLVVFNPDISCRLRAEENHYTAKNIEFIQIEDPIAQRKPFTFVI